MNLLKKVFFTVLTIILLSGLGAYFYFKNAFKPPENLAHVIGNETQVPLAWTSNVLSKKAGVFVPVTLPYASETFYMQFDLGAVYSVVYNTSIQSIRKKYNLPHNTNEDYFKNFKVKLGELTVEYDSIKNLDYGEALEWNDTIHKKIIGTIGVDFLERVKSIIDFKSSQAMFLLKTPDSLKNYPFKTKFEFKERKILIPTTLNGETKTLMWDTGASAYDLITSKDNWQKMALNPETVKPHDANQLRRKLKVYTANSDVELNIGKENLHLETVTYVEGFPWYVALAMKFSGMEGMIGNNLFEGRRIYIDPQEESFILFPN